jgi:heme/copper-type cytochrome/quinol oxidase subunit 2
MCSVCSSGFTLFNGACSSTSNVAVSGGASDPSEVKNIVIVLLVFVIAMLIVVVLGFVYIFIKIRQLQGDNNQ